MPINLQPKDVSDDLQNVSSVLIVLCPVCPQFSLAMQQNSPWIEFFKYGLKTGALEDHIKEIRRPLEKRGVRTGVFTMRLPLPMMCLWTKGQRKRLLKRAKNYEVAVVLGCDSAAFSATGPAETRIKTNTVHVKIRSCLVCMGVVPFSSNSLCPISVGLVRGFCSALPSASRTYRPARCSGKTLSYRCPGPRPLETVTSARRWRRECIRRERRREVRGAEIPETSLQLDFAVFGRQV